MTEEAQTINPTDKIQDPDPAAIPDPIDAAQEIQDKLSIADDSPIPESGEMPDSTLPEADQELFADRTIEPQYPEPTLTEIIPDGTHIDINMLIDVPVRVTAELGRTRMTVQQILELERGSVVELDRIAGDPIDMFVNDHLIARGEVVVVDDNFGIRITEIIPAPPITGAV